MKTKQKPVWHGQDKDAAIKRAKEISGRVIWSTPPDNDIEGNQGEMGYWSDTNGFIRVWESVVFETQ